MQLKSVDIVNRSIETNTSISRYPEYHNYSVIINGNYLINYFAPSPRKKYNTKWKPRKKFTSL